MTPTPPVSSAPEVRARPEGGGDFAPALGGGSGANRAAGGPEEKSCIAWIACNPRGPVPHV